MWRVTPRRASIVFVLTLSCWLSADMVNVYVSHALLQVTPPEPATASPVAQPPSPDATKMMVKAILSSGVFVVPANALALDPGTQTVKSPPPPLELNGKLKLLGTALGEHAASYAAIESVTDKKQRLYALNEDVEGFGQMIEIRRDGVKLRQGEREGELLLFEPIEPIEPNGQTVASISAKSPSTPKDNRVVVDRRLLVESFSDLPKLMNEAKAVPYYNTLGKIDGWQFIQVRPESVFGRLGLIPGDVLQRINGTKVEDPSRILTFFQQVQHERAINLDLLRQLEPLRITYEIR